MALHLKCTANECNWRMVLKISEAENARLNQEYWAWVNWRKHGTVPMNNHGMEEEMEPPKLSLGPSSLDTALASLSLYGKTIVYGKRTLHLS